MRATSLSSSSLADASSTERASCRFFKVSSGRKTTKQTFSILIALARTELSPVFLHIPRSAQAVAAQTLYINIHRWIRFDPSGWVDLYQSGRRFEGDPSSLFDVCFSIVGDSNTLSAQKAGTFWLVMTMLLALCPGLIERIVNGDNEGGRGSGSLGKKVHPATVI